MRPRKARTRLRLHIRVSGICIGSNRAPLCETQPLPMSRKEAIANSRVPPDPLRRYSPGEGAQPSMSDAVTKPKTKVKTKTKAARPRLHKVILINDDYTPREFVVTVLKAEFRMTEDQAYKVMITAHKLGVCVVAVFTKDVAETKATRATDAGRAKGYPLLFTTEPEE